MLGPFDFVRPAGLCIIALGSSAMATKAVPIAAAFDPWAGLPADEIFGKSNDKVRTSQILLSVSIERIFILTILGASFDMYEGW